MTTFDDPHGQDELDELDLLASLYVDGEATPEERARVEADPAARERVAEFMLLQDAVSAPVTPADLATRERTIAAALAHAPGSAAAPVQDSPISAAPPSAAPSAAAPPSAPSAPVRSLDAQRARRAERRTRFLQAAAALAMIGVGGAVIFNLGAQRGSDITEVSSAAIDTADDAAGDVASAPASAGEALAVPVPALQAETQASSADNDDEAMAEDAMIDATADDADEAMEEEAMEEAMEEEAAMEDEPEAESAAQALTNGDSAGRTEGTDLEQRIDAEADLADQDSNDLTPEPASELTEAWVKSGSTEPEPVFKARTDFLGEYASLDELIPALLIRPGETFDEVLEPLSGSDCAALLQDRENGTAVIVATAVLTTSDSPSELVIVQRPDGSLEAHDRMTCEIPITGLR